MNRRTMNLFTRLLGWISPLTMPALAVQAQTPAPYALPDRFQFAYKVVQQIHQDDTDKPQTQTLYFTRNGEYMATLPTDDDSNTELIINTKDGYIITFGREIHDNRKRQVGGPIYRNVLTVRDMRRVWKGIGTAMLPVGKALSRKSKSTDDGGDKADKSDGMMDNFQKTGRTKMVAGYQAEEYAKIMPGQAGASGTFSVWYAHVDFDPSLLFGMGMGSMASPEVAQRMQATHPNNMMGIGMTQKNYLLAELSATMAGGPEQPVRRVTSIEKTAFSKSVEGYYIKNYSGMSLEDMMKKEAIDDRNQ